MSELVGGLPRFSAGFIPWQSSRSLLERLQPAGSPSQPPMLAACPSYLSFLPPEALQYATKPCEITAPGGTEITLRNTEPTASHPSIRERLTRVATGIPYHSVSSLRVLLMRTPPNGREFQGAGRQWPLPGREPSPAHLGNCTDDLEAGGAGIQYSVQPCRSTADSQRRST